MPESITIKQLFQAYKQERVVSVNVEQFTSFTVFFPTLLVIISDGVIDLEEWEYVKQLARFMAKSFKEEGAQEVNIDELADAYLDEISYLVKFLRDWQSQFLEALKSYVVEKPEIKPSIKDTIYLFAEASDGTSTEEQEKIDFLEDYLQLD